MPTSGDAAHYPGPVPAVAHPTPKNEFVVTRFDDRNSGNCLPGDCSLREAVISANAAGVPSTVLLPAGTYSLTIPGRGEDLAATVFLQAVKGIDSFVYKGAPFLTWLYRIARNIAADHYRSELGRHPAGSGGIRARIPAFFRSHYADGEASGPPQGTLSDPVISVSLSATEPVTNGILYRSATSVATRVNVLT